MKISYSRGICLIFSQTLFLLLLMLFLLYCVKIGIKKDTTEGINNSWESDFQKEDGDGWYIDASLSPEGEKVVLLTGPNGNINKGNYTIKVDYYADNAQLLSLEADTDDKEFINKGRTPVILDNRTNYIESDFEIKQNIQSFRIMVNYSGEGTFWIKNISIEPNTNGLKRAFVIFVVLFGLMDFYVFFYERLINYKKTIGLLLLIVVLASLPIFAQGINLGHDYQFHLLRIEGVASAIKHGQFPVRIEEKWLAGYGYASSIFYPSTLLYLPALLRIMGFSIDVSYKVYLFFVNFITTFIAYYSLKLFTNKYWVKGTKDISCNTVLLGMTFAYVTSYYRMVNLYIRSAVGEYSALAFVPLIFIAFFDQYFVNDDDNKSLKHDVFLMVVGLTGIIETHILTVQMVFVFVMLGVVLSIKKSATKKIISFWVKAVGWTILINLWIFVPFLDYWINVPVGANSGIHLVSGTAIQNMGMDIVQLFSFFQPPYGLWAVSLGNRIGLGVGALLMIVFLIALYLVLINKSDARMKMMTLGSALALWMSTNFFPWNALSRVKYLGDFLVMVQFPWRYLGIASVILVFLGVAVWLKLCTNGNKTILYTVVACITLLSYFIWISEYVDSAQVVDYYDTTELDSFCISGSEYIRVVDGHISTAGLDGKVEASNVEACNIIEKDGTYVKIECKTMGEEGSVSIPLLNYKGYHAVLNNGIEAPIQDGNDGEISIKLPQNYDGEVVVEFREPWYWRISEFTSLIVSMIFIFYYIKSVYINLNKNENRC